MAKRYQFKCDICDYSTSQKQHMKAHIEAVHERKKPNKYSICDYSASQKQHLKTHIESVHERKKTTR